MKKIKILKKLKFKKKKNLQELRMNKKIYKNQN